MQRLVSKCHCLKIQRCRLHVNTWWKSLGQGHSVCPSRESGFSFRSGKLYQCAARHIKLNQTIKDTDELQGVKAKQNNAPPKTTFCLTDMQQISCVQSKKNNINTFPVPDVAPDMSYYGSLCSHFQGRLSVKHLFYEQNKVLKFKI